MAPEEWNMQHLNMKRGVMIGRLAVCLPILAEGQIICVSTLYVTVALLMIWGGVGIEGSISPRGHALSVCFMTSIHGSRDLKVVALRADLAETAWQYNHDLYLSVLPCIYFHLFALASQMQFKGLH